MIISDRITLANIYDGNSITINGELDSILQLPTTGKQGEYYLIDGDLWGWDGTKWVNIGKIEGKPGTDGTTYYTWYRYSPNANGVPMQATPANMKYIGISYGNLSPMPSTNPLDYEWALFKGEDGVDGEDGKDGVNGADGVTYYTWIKYADDRNGNGMSEIPDNKKYLGIAFNQTSPNESTNPKDYTWALIKGEDGIQGPPGENGKPTYTWVRYATDEFGSNMSSDPTGKSYIGIAYNKQISTPSTNPKDYTWALYRGPQGVPGQDGKPGQDGAPGEDSYAVTILSSGGLVFKNGKGSSTLTVKLYKGPVEYDSDGRLYTYSWEKYTNGQKDNWSATGKQIEINQNHVDGATTFQVKVGTVAQGQVTIADLSDVVASETEPVYKVVGSLWYKPSEGKTYIWTGTKWEVTIVPEVIGASNLILNSRLRDNKKWDNLVATWSSIDNNFLYKGRNTVKVDVPVTDPSAGGSYKYTYQNFDARYFAVGEAISVQAKVYLPNDHGVPDSPHPVYVGVYCYDANGANLRSKVTKVDISLKEKWQHLKVENLKVANNTSQIRFVVGNRNGGKYWWVEPQLERGTVCTDFRESIQDVQEQADELTNTVLDIEERIEDGKIISTVLGSEEANILFDSKANAEDVKDLITDEQLQNYLDQQKKYIDDKIGGIDMTNFVNKTDFIQSMKDFQFKFEQGGGVNLIRDSLGSAINHSVWTDINRAIPTNNPTIESLGFSSGWRLSHPSDWCHNMQIIKVNPNKTYTISGFVLTKAKTTQVCIYAVKNGIRGELLVHFLLTQGLNYDYFYKSFTIKQNEIIISIESFAGESIFTGLMLNQGEIPMSWQAHPTEMYNANTKIDMNGVTVNRMDGDTKVGYTAMTPREFAGYYRNPSTGQMERVFALNEDYTVTKKVIADNEVNVGSLKIVYINSGGKKGVAFVPLTNPIEK